MSSCTVSSFQRICDSLLPTLLLRYQGEEKRRLLLRPLLERRTPDLGSAGLHAHLQRGALPSVAAPHTRISAAEAATCLAGRAAAAPAHCAQLYRIFLLTVVVRYLMIVSLYSYLLLQPFVTMIGTVRKYIYLC